MILRAIAPLLVAGLVATTCENGPGPGSSSTLDEIIIASDLPSSGFANDALPAQQAIAFAIRQQRTIGRYTLRYWPLDDSLAALPSPARAIGNVDRMVDRRQVLGMIGPLSSNVAPYEIPLTNQADLAMLSPSNTNDCLTLTYCDPSHLVPRPTGVNNYFRIAAPDPVQGRAMARYAAQTLGLSRVAIFDELDSADGVPIITEFTGELSRWGGHVVLSKQLTPSDAPDYSTFLTQARSRGAQAIYAVGMAQDHDCRARAQMERLLPGAYFLTWDGIDQDNENCFPDAGADTSRMFGTFSDVDPRHDPQLSKDAAAYLTAYPKAADVSIYTFAAYDCARMMIAAIARAVRDNHGAIPSRPQVVTALAATQGFKGVTGTFSFDANGDAVSPLMSIYQVQNGKWTYLERIEASKQN